VLLGTGVALHPEWRERRALAQLPAATSEQVSVLLIILDTVRAASLGLYGYDRPTSPELQRLAASGVTFDQAIAPASWTLPSHATMFTGRYLRELGVDWTTPLDRRHATIAEILAHSGFSTAAFSANVGYVSKDAGLARGFARFEDFVATPGEMVRTSVMLERILTPFGLRAVVTDDNRGRRSAEDINDAFLSWLDRRPRDRPYFAFLNYFDAHAPFYAAPPFDTLFGGPVSHLDLAPWKRYLPRRHINQWRDAYDRSLVYIDAELGRLFRELERRRSLDSLVVIVTSDHGELLGEHSFMGHATTLYRPVVEVPLVIRGPGVPRGVRVNERVALRDLPSTILQLARVANASPIPGQSLAHRWKGDTASAPVISELGRGLRIASHYPNAADDLWSAFQEDAHYIVSSSGTEQFYRISGDPAELQNLAREMPAPPELAELREVIRRHRASERADAADWPRARK
jgi:arylsulfatase A-like enzyme